MSKEGIWRSILIKKHPINCNEKIKSNLKLMNIDNHFLHTTEKQKWNGDNWMSESHINTLRIGRGVEWHDYCKRRKKSRFFSYDKGTLIIPIEDQEENYHKTVRFKEIKILFY